MKSWTSAPWEGGTEGGRRTSRCRVEMTGTCFFTFFFLLSFLCFIKGSTKGKLCYLLKNVKVHFKQEEKKQTHYCLDRGGSAVMGAARHWCVGGHAATAGSPDLWVLLPEASGPT